MPSFESSPEKREDSIDLIRAVAILSVLLYHYTARYTNDYLLWHYTGFQFTYGYLGVELFFILSGYCIYLTISRSRSLVDFFAKRLSRLWPALIIAATITFLVVHTFGLPGRGTSVIKYLSNLLFLNVLTDHYVDGAYWSLTIEVKFYLWFGLLYFLNKKHVAKLWAYFTLAGMAASGIALVTSHYAPISDVFQFLAGWVLIYPYAVWFLVGITIYEWEWRSWSQRALLLAPAGIGLLISAYGNQMEALILLGCIIGSILVIPMRNLTIPGPIRFIGLISYPLYLVHQNVGIIIIRELTTLDPYLRIMIASAVVIAIAAVIHYGIEWRFRPSFRRYIRNTLAWLFSKFGKPTEAMERFLEFPLY